MKPAGLLFPLCAAAGAFAIAATVPLVDPDMYWHLASGQWMLDHHEILRSDVFSSTVAGQPYSVGEWLGELVFAVVFNVGGWAGLAIFRALLAAAAAFALAGLSRRRGAPLIAALLVVAWAVVFSKTRWIDRPAIFTLVLFPVVLDLLYAARAGSRRALMLIPPLILVWANLHGGYAIGLALVLAFTVEAAARGRSEFVPFASALVASVGFSFIDPETFGVAGAAAHAIAPPRFISEEAPPDILEPAGLIFGGFVLATLGLAMLCGGILLDAVVLIPLLWLALSAQRHLAFFVFAATPYVAAEGSRLYLRLRPHGTPMRPVPRRLSIAIGMLFAAAAVASAIGRPSAPDEQSYPRGAIAALRTGSGTLLNEYDWGGFLIYHVPERKVFVDGRLFPFYPAVLRDYRDAVELQPDWKDVLVKYDVREALLTPAKPLAVALREDGWRVRAEGQTFVLLAKP